MKGNTLKHLKVILIFFMSGIFLFISNASALPPEGSRVALLPIKIKDEQYKKHGESLGLAVEKGLKRNYKVFFGKDVLDAMKKPITKASQDGTDFDVCRTHLCKKGVALEFSAYVATVKISKTDNASSFLTSLELEEVSNSSTVLINSIVSECHNCTVGKLAEWLTKKAEELGESIIGNLIPVEPGQFRMGNKSSTQRDEKIVVTVKIGRKFDIMENEVTLKQWRKCEDDGSCSTPGNNGNSTALNRPVTAITLKQIKSEFIPWLQKKTSRQFRLPSEAEWEYVARKTSRSDSLQLYQSLFNDTLERVEDCWHDSYEGHPKTEVAWTENCTNPAGVVRGKASRSSGKTNRGFMPHSHAGYNLGFRLVTDSVY